MTTRQGLRKMRCEVCGEELELEAGIKNMFHCAQRMVDVTDEEVGEQAPTLKIEPRQ